MGWKVVISPGAVDDAAAFSVPGSVSSRMKFDIQGQVQDNELGQVLYTEYHVEVEGDVIASTAGTVGTNLLAIMDQLKEYAPRNVYISLDGTTKYTWTKATCVGSPRVIAFRTVDEDGNADSHWRYAFTIYAKQLGNLGVAEFSTSLMTQVDQGILVKKVWRAYAKSSSMAQALAKVMSFKPSQQSLSEEIERRFQDVSVLAVWTWDINKNFVLTEEPIEYTGNGKSYVWDYAVSDGANPPPPIIHRAANEITRIVVKGVVRGPDPGTLSPPTAHFNDNGSTMVRCEAEETRYFPTLEDQLLGIYATPYMEVWYFTGPGMPPAPNHSGHLKPLYTPPADGSIVGQR